MPAQDASRRECAAQLARRDGSLAPALLAFGWLANDPLAVTARVSVIRPDGSTLSDVWLISRDFLGDLVRHGQAGDPSIPGAPLARRVEGGLYGFTLTGRCQGLVFSVTVPEIDVLAFLVTTEALIPAGSPAELGAVDDDLDGWLDSTRRP